MKKAVLAFVVAGLLAGCSSNSSESNITLGEKGKEEYLRFNAGEVHWVTVGDLMPTQKTIANYRMAISLVAGNLSKRNFSKSFVKPTAFVIP